MVNASHLQQFKTHQQPPQRAMQRALGEEATSGFFSGVEMAGLRGALQGYDLPSASKLFNSNNEPSKPGYQGPSLPQSASELPLNHASQDSIPQVNDTSLAGPSGILHQALQPDSVFDLPSAVSEIYKALHQIQALKA